MRCISAPVNEHDLLSPEIVPGDERNVRLPRIYLSPLQEEENMRRRDFLSQATMGALVAGTVEGFAYRATASEHERKIKPASRIAVDMPWRRRDEPVLSSQTMGLDWCQTYCYSPCVVRTRDGYRMYFIGRTGNSSDLRSLMGFVVGTATSTDGLTWEPHPTPVLTFADVPWGAFALQTPFVLWDEDENTFKLWFIGVTEWVRDARGGTTEITQRLGYATSDNGIDWIVHPAPIYESGRRPCINKIGPNDYRMWMNSRPKRQENFLSLYQNVYEFRSPDGIDWQRSDEPVLRESEKHEQGCIYPFVCRDAGRYYLWYGAYPKKEDKSFQIYLAESDDGTHWVNHDSAPAFPNADDHDRFDSFYVSTPCVLVEPDRYLLYYSAVSWDERDKGSYYQSIGLATCART